MQAYKALTDETSRTNYQKYGHPDGPQAMSGGCALRCRQALIARLPACLPALDLRAVLPLPADACLARIQLYRTSPRAPFMQPHRPPSCPAPPRQLSLAHPRPASSCDAVSVALPEWFFSKDKQTAPLILLVLLFGGIVTPLGVAAWYLMGTQK
jgi:hypothetical protein